MHSSLLCSSILFFFSSIKPTKWYQSYLLTGPVKMEVEESFSEVAPPVFDGENYDLWAIRMESYLEALDLWEVMEEDYNVPPLPDNLTMAQIKNHKERKTKKAKAKSCLSAGVSKIVFTRIMTIKTPNAIWDYLKEECAGDERI